MHGHIYEFLEKEVDYIFTPFMINAKAEKDNPTNNCNCPWIQAFPYMVNAALGDKEKEKLMIPTLTFRYFGKVTATQLYDFFGKKFNLSKKQISDAMYLADDKQNEFEIESQETWP